MIDRFLPQNATLRRALLWGVLVAATLLLTQVVFAGPGGAAGRGTPAGTLFFGAVNGLVMSLAAVGVVLIYRTIRVINFAQTALGLAGAFLVFGFVQWTGVPFPIALVLGLLVSGVVGAVVGVLLLRFFNASRLVLTVVTIVGANVITQLASRIYSLPFFPDESELPFDELAGAASLRPRLPFAGLEFFVGGQRPGYGFSELFAIQLSLLLLVALGAFFRFTRAGIAVRGMAENAQRASLLGIGVGGLSVAVWLIAGVLSGAGATMTGMLSTPSQAAGFPAVFVLTTFTGAVLARMEKIPTAVVACVLLSTIREAFTYSYPQDRNLSIVGLFLVLVVALLLQPRRRGRSELGSGATWAAVEEQRPVPKVLASLAPVRTMRWGIGAVLLIAFLVLPFAVGTGFINTMSVLVLGAIVTISIVVLTGWGGQVSLGQWGFAAVGAVVGGSLTASVGLPFWLAVPLAAAVTGAFAMLVGIPALRIPGLFLLPVTFGFAVVVQAVLFEERYFGWLLPTEAIERPTLFLLDFRDDRSMYFLCLACLIVAVLVVANLRRSRTGRILIALRENDANVQAFGVPVVRTKLVAFGIAGALAGFAGSVFVHQQQGLSVESFVSTRSIDAFVMAVFGGVGSPVGALLGTAWTNFIQYFGVSGLWGTFAQSGGPLLLIFVAPGGLIALINAMRDSVLRVVAQRRQLVVPSLFADFDPEALEKRLIPLADADTGSGLAVLPPGVRFELRSELYGGARRQLIEPSVTRKEAAAIGAAAAGIQEHAEARA